MFLYKKEILKMIIFESFIRKVCNIFDIIKFKREIYDKWEDFTLLLNIIIIMYIYLFVNKYEF